VHITFPTLFSVIGFKTILDVLCLEIKINLIKEKSLIKRIISISKECLLDLVIYNK